MCQPLVIYYAFLLTFFTPTLLYSLRPVPAGISLPIITFSLSPSRWSTLPRIAASVRAFVVSWKEAADKNDSVEEAAW